MERNGNKGKKYTMRVGAGMYAMRDGMHTGMVCYAGICVQVSVRYGLCTMRDGQAGRSACTRYVL